MLADEHGVHNVTDCWLIVLARQRNFLA